jgi:hypothetical protein
VELNEMPSEEKPRQSRPAMMRDRLHRRHCSDYLRDIVVGQVKLKERIRGLEPQAHLLHKQLGDIKPGHQNAFLSSF